MSRPRTAAVIATFDQESFIREAVLSVADQVDEVIVIDDCSRDATWEVLSALRHPRVRASRNAVNLGVSQTFNVAVRAAEAEIILIQGGDDISLPHRAHEQVDVLADPLVSLVFSRPEVINSAAQAAPDWLVPEFFPAASQVPHVARLLFDSNYICAPSVAMRRNHYLELGGFHPALDLVQDYELWLKATEVGEIVEIEHPVVRYRKHAANLSRDYVGVDGPKHRRLRAEQDFVRGSFIEGATTQTLDRLATGIGLDMARFQTLTRAERIVMIFLTHPDPLMKRRGTAGLIALAGKGDYQESFARVGLHPTDLARLMFDADHDNMNQVTRALQAGAAGAVSSPPPAARRSVLAAARTHLGRLLRR